MEQIGEVAIGAFLFLVTIDILSRAYALHAPPASIALMQLPGGTTAWTGAPCSGGLGSWRWTLIPYGLDRHLDAILAHEGAHHNLRHHALLSYLHAVKLVAVVGMIIAGQFGVAAIVWIWVEIMCVPIQRRMEYEADAVAIRFVAPEKYDEMLSAGKRWGGFLHPSRDARLKRLRRLRGS